MRHVLLIRFCIGIDIKDGYIPYVEDSSYLSPQNHRLGLCKYEQSSTANGIETIRSTQV